MNVADTRPDLTAWALAMKSRAHRLQFDDEQMAIALDYATRAEEYLSLAPAASALVAADVMQSNAMVAFATGNFTTAAELTEQRLATLRTSGLEHGRPVQQAQQDRGVYWTRVDVHRALRSREEVYLQQARLWGGVRHRQVAIAAKELVHSLVRSGAQGDCARGFNLAEEALHWYQTVTGTRHQDTRRTRGIWCLAAYRLSDELEHAGDAAGSAQLRSDALTAAKLNVELATQDDTPERKASYRSRLAQALVRNFDPAGVQILREDLPVRCGETHFSDSEWPRADDPLSIEILWDVAELVAALHRFGEATEASDLVRRFGLEQVDDWPPYLTRGWRSTRPEHARAGVL
jgi:hypothetical protein